MSLRFSNLSALSKRFSKPIGHIKEVSQTSQPFKKRFFQTYQPSQKGFLKLEISDRKFMMYFWLHAKLRFSQALPCSNDLMSHKTKFKNNKNHAGPTIIRIQFGSKNGLILAQNGRREVEVFGLNLAKLIFFLFLCRG